MHSIAWLQLTRKGLEIGQSLPQTVQQQQVVAMRLASVGAYGRKLAGINSYHDHNLYEPVLDYDPGLERDSFISERDASDVIRVVPQRTWKSYIWDSLDKSPEERRFLFKLDAAVLTIASLGYVHTQCTGTILVAKKSSSVTSSRTLIKST